MAPTFLHRALSPSYSRHPSTTRQPWINSDLGTPQRCSCNHDLTHTHWRELKAQDAHWTHSLGTSAALAWVTWEGWLKDQEHKERSAPPLQLQGIVREETGKGSTSIPCPEPGVTSRMLFQWRFRLILGKIASPKGLPGIEIGCPAMQQNHNPWKDLKDVKCSCGTWGHGLLANMAVLGKWLGSMIFESPPT